MQLRQFSFYFIFKRSPSHFRVIQNNIKVSIADLSNLYPHSIFQNKQTQKTSIFSSVLSHLYWVFNGAVLYLMNTSVKGNKLHLGYRSLSLFNYNNLTIATLQTFIIMYFIKCINYYNTLLKISTLCSNKFPAKAKI